VSQPDAHRTRTSHLSHVCKQHTPTALFLIYIRTTRRSKVLLKPMPPVGRHWSATLGLPLEVITLCHHDILSMPVSHAGKHAAGPMAQKLASYEWTFGEFRQQREGTRHTDTPTRREIVDSLARTHERNSHTVNPHADTEGRCRVKVARRLSRREYTAVEAACPASHLSEHYWRLT
jgi:hypothetical protein